jgi:hypothetical protein
MEYVLHADEFKKLDKELKYLDNYGVRIGFLNDTDRNKDGDVILFYALYNEYGTAHIPARPFFRTAIKENAKKIEERLKSNFGKVILGKMTGNQALVNIGLLVKGMIQDSIKHGDWEENSEVTIAMKGNKNPLIDTGSMIEAVDYEIVKGG